jgi:hypothetical protein
MKPQSFFSAVVLPLLVASSPSPEAKPKAEPEASPQLQFLPFIAAGTLATLATGGVLLGTLGSLGANAGRGGAGACRCDRAPSCKGTKCECQNEIKISCWVEKRGACKIDLQSCPATAKGGNGLPTPLGSQYPPCGRGLPDCVNEKYCKKLDANCYSVFDDGGCLGICVPKFPDIPADQQTAKDNRPKGNNNPWWQPRPKQGQNPPVPQQQQQGQRPAGPGLCPPNFVCPSSSVCVADPRSGNQSFMCVAPTEICGGFRNDVCYNGKICVRDPRLTCEGQGCTGICV